MQLYVCNAPPVALRPLLLSLAHEWFHFLQFLLYWLTHQNLLELPQHVGLFCPVMVLIFYLNTFVQFLVSKHNLYLGDYNTHMDKDSLQQ